MNPVDRRRLFGLGIGAVTGLAYSLVAQSINLLVMPGIPFYQPPFGPPGNVLLGLLLGALLGFLTAWAETSLKGVLVGSLAGTAVLALASLLTGENSPQATWLKILGVFLIVIPTTGILAPVLMLFRWLVNREEEAYLDAQRMQPPNRIQRVLPPVLVVLAAGALGLTSMYNGMARIVTPRMFELIESSRGFTSPEALPEALGGENVRHYLENANQPYTLEWSKDDTNQFAIPRPNTSTADQSTVIARFQNGYLLACVFPTPSYEPRCKDFLSSADIP